MIDRDRHAAIPDLGQKVDRIEQFVMGQAVGIVAEEHGNIAGLQGRESGGQSYFRGGEALFQGGHHVGRENWDSPRTRLL